MAEHERGVIVLPPPPDDIERRRPATPPAGVNSTPHHWAPGPGNCRPARPFWAPDAAGNVRRYTWRLPWYLDAVRGTSRRAALTALYRVLRDPQGWERSGVRFVRVANPARAAVRVSVIPGAESVCGAGAAGCYSWGGGRLPLVEVGVEYLNRPGPWAVIAGMEFAHAAFAMSDMYDAKHQPYFGVLGGWEQAAAAGWRPTDEEINAARAWLAGAPGVVIEPDE